MANRLVSVDDNLHLPTAVRNQLKADVEADVAGSVTTAQSAAAAASSARDEAVDAAEQAQAIVTADLDGAMGILVNDTDSDTRTALDGVYPLKTSVPQSLYGTYSARPAASSVPVGSVYYASDTLEQYRSNGTSWQIVGPAGNEIAYAEITAAFTSTTASAVDVPGLTVTWTAGERPVYLFFSGLMACGSSTPLVWARLILGTSTLVGVGGTTATQNVSVERSVRLAGLTPGTSYTAKVRIDLPGGTTGVSSGQVNAAPTNPASLRVVAA